MSDKHVLVVRSKCLQLIQIEKIIESVFIKNNARTRAHNKNRDRIVNKPQPKDGDNGIPRYVVIELDFIMMQSSYIVY